MTAPTLRLVVLSCSIFLHSSAESGTHSVTALGWLWGAKNKKWSQNQTFSFRILFCWIHCTTEMTSNWGSKFPPSSCVEQGLPGIWSVGCCLRLGAASATWGRHETVWTRGGGTAQQHCWNSRAHQYLLQRDLSYQDNCFKVFSFVLLGSKLRKQAHTLSINFSNLIPQSCGVHWTSWLLSVSVVVKGAWVVDFFLLHFPPTDRVSVCPRHQLKVCTLLTGKALFPLLGWSSLLNSENSDCRRNTRITRVPSRGLRQTCFLIIGLPFFQLICKMLVS